MHDSGDENDQAFLVCELLEGRALDEEIGNRPFEIERVLDIAFQVVEALAAAHRRGIVHGRVKPSNVFITTDGHVKLLELGATAALAGDAGSSTTGSETASVRVAVASPGLLGEYFHPYMSPEQVAGTAADERSDIFAVGALLYHMATGMPPFRGDTIADVALAITSRQPARVRSLNPRAAGALETIIERALQKNPADRYSSRRRDARRPAPGQARRRNPRAA